MFEPFFTTKPPGKGNGLGLSIVRQVVTLHGGRIDIRNREGGGVSVTITLPVAAWALGSGPRLVTLATVMSVLAIYKHKANIQRLLNGTENRMGAKSKMTKELK